MRHPELVRYDSTSGHSYCLLDVPYFGDWPDQLRLPSSRFVLFLACDARDLSSNTIGRAALAAIRQGAVYVCAWGPDCGRVHEMTSSTRFVSS
jgi:hypothetical protein